ncbi:hypothetical protein HJC23_008162 [Cyclotella cryptica]|uniref:WRKY transcription factor 19 n=1 Tax=Cyclotella cryptica TaxID=29204 RepID=A0ABD3PP96_9STRA
MVSIIRIPTRAQDDTPNMSHIMSSQLFPGGPHQSPPLGGNSGNELKPLSIRKANKRTCSVVGCKNGIVQGGVCISHGAKRRKCRFPGCEKNSKSAGLCSRHGPPRKKCDAGGCTNVAVQGGKCKSHGVPLAKCKVPGCTNTASSGERCRRHRDFVMPSEQDYAQKQGGGLGAAVPSFSGLFYAPVSDNITRDALNSGFTPLIRSFCPQTSEAHNSMSARQNHELLQLAQSQNSLAASMLSNFAMGNTASCFMNPMAASVAASSGVLMNPAMVMTPMAFNPMAATMGMNFPPQAVTSFGYGSQMNPSSALFGNGYLGLGSTGIATQGETKNSSNHHSLSMGLNESDEVKSHALRRVDDAEVKRIKSSEEGPQPKEW